MLQVCWNTQGLLWKDRWALVETFYPGFYWLCFYVGILASRIRTIIDMVLILGFPLLSECFVPWFLLILWNFRECKCLCGCLVGNFLWAWWLWPLGVPVKIFFLILKADRIDNRLWFCRSPQEGGKHTFQPDLIISSPWDVGEVNEWGVGEIVKSGLFKRVCYSAGDGIVWLVLMEGENQWV